MSGAGLHVCGRTLRRATTAFGKDCRARSSSSGFGMMLVIQRSFLRTLLPAVLFTLSYEVSVAAALVYPDLTNSCGENGVGAGDMLHKRTFSHHCLCPAGTQCEGPEGQCQKHGDGDKINLATRVHVFNIKDCPTCTCTALPDDWEETPLGSQIIVALDGSEGMASWRFSVAEMIFTARLLSCRLVLPCVHGGRLVPCHLEKAASIGTYVDLDLLKTYWPRIMPYSELMELDKVVLNPKTSTGWRGSTNRVVCVSHRCGQKGFENVRLDGLRSKNGLGVLPTAVPVVRHYNRPIPLFIDLFLKTAVSVNQKNHVTLMTTWFKGAIRLASLANKKANGANMNEDFGVTRVWRYAPTVLHQIERIKQELNLADTFVAIHWRSERTECKFKECADNLLGGLKLELQKYRSLTAEQAENRGVDWNVPGKKHCLLISDIPVNIDRSLWGPFSVTEFENEGRVEGMKYVLDTFGVTAPVDWGGCGKLDALEFLDDVDTGLLSLYDKILGKNATEFHTCKDNKRSSVCGVCARVMSQFAKEINESRLKAKLKKWTHTAWPSSQDDALIIAAGASVKSTEKKAENDFAGVVPADFDQAAAMQELNHRTVETFGCGSKEHALIEQAPARLISSAPSSSGVVLRHRGSILWTFPGAGNTWCRSLLEHATGYLTGSVYNDPSLKKMFRAEGKSKTSAVVAIKAHPNVKGWDADRLKSRFGPNASLILVVRDPYRSFWSEGQRRITRSLRKKALQAGVKLDGTAHAMQVTKKHLTANQNWMKWKGLAMKLADDYTQMWRSYKAMIRGGSDHVFIAYEDLKTKETREHALSTMLDFVGEGFDAAKIKCAFHAAENGSIHRAAPAGGSATFEDAFPPGLACKVWASLLPGKAIAEQLGYKWAYQPPAGVAECDGEHFVHVRVPPASPLVPTTVAPWLVPGAAATTPAGWVPCSTDNEPDWCTTDEAKCGNLVVASSGAGAGLPSLAVVDVCPCKCKDVNE